jgi:uncharacterized membrane protein
MAGEPQAPTAPAPNGERCIICGLEKSRRGGSTLQMVRPSVLELIRDAKPDLPANGFICRDDLARFRARYVEKVLIAERGDLSALERDVLESLARHEIVSADIESQFAGQRTFGERLSDLLASFGGSWTFILIFCALMALWIVVNGALATTQPFDPYPYILLNLVLSCLAALQAPIIMMSQKRLEAKDRLRSESDYRVNLKAELEIRHLHEKVDHILTRQWDRLAEIQEIQVEMMQDMASRRR